MKPEKREDLIEAIINMIWDKGFCEKCKPPTKIFISLDVCNLIERLGL